MTVRTRTHLTTVLGDSQASQSDEDIDSLLKQRLAARPTTRESDGLVFDPAQITRSNS